MKLGDEKQELTNETQVQAMWPDPNWESHLDQCFFLSMFHRMLQLLGAFQGLPGVVGSRWPLSTLCFIVSTAPLLSVSYAERELLVRSCLINSVPCSERKFANRRFRGLTSSKNKHREKPL